ncbi:DMT family transporter [Methylicorpusculum sp.]|uniref:DMT family transporter n=1 Tax=Methylicorpusculum sp. TaxID=2713644 RepID=UPI0027200B31|nr:DMT family transporter [Methylicorpusculum sp.]MDO9239851.1 DMT family transporter [Methylicorpusculum sp.]MDP2180701.1 DMT family transporter [Methylicorpusculum sp.]MDZ4149728.1 DMT family transporter [Methylicorpusculum sp.]
MKIKNTAASGIFLVLMGALGFSTKSIFVKSAYQVSGQLDAISLLALRMLFSLPIFLLIGLWQQKKHRPNQSLSKKTVIQLFALGFAGYYLASYLDFKGLQFISAGLERVLLFLYPTFVVLFSALLQRRWIKTREFLALLFCYGGLVCVFADNLTVKTPDWLLGSLLVLGSAVVFAGFTMGSGAMVKIVGSARFTTYTMSIAGFLVLLHFSLTSGTHLLDFPFKLYWLVMLMALFSTVLPAYAMNAGILRIGASSASIISSIGPIVTLLLAYVFLNEAISWLQLSGTVLVIIGVFVVSRPGN